jgi:hypothetical protein
MTFFHKNYQQHHENDSKDYLKDTPGGKTVFTIVTYMQVANQEWEQDDATYDSCIKI